MPDLYLDTSALAKRYVAEHDSDDFEAFLAAEKQVLIARLAIVEIRCLLARRRRTREISGAYERQALAAFEADLIRGPFHVEPLADRHALLAFELIARLQPAPLRTLDALHLATALDSGCERLATADKVMADCGNRLGLKIARFRDDA